MLGKFLLFFVLITTSSASFSEIDEAEEKAIGLGSSLGDVIDFFAGEEDPKPSDKAVDKRAKIIEQDIAPEEYTPPVQREKTSIKPPVKIGDKLEKNLHINEFFDELFVKENLSSNRGGAISRGTLQIALFYDGAGEAKISIALENLETQSISNLEIGGIGKFSKIYTYEFNLADKYRPTGCFEVTDVKDDGVIDGLAFGVFYKNQASKYSLFKSQEVDHHKQGKLNFVGMWPLGLWDKRLQEITPQLEGNGFAREQVRGMLYGAKLLGNGTYCLEGH